MKNRMKLLAAVAVAGMSAVGVGVLAAAPAQADSAGNCYRVVTWSGDMCLFYHSNYGGSDTGLWKDSYHGAHTWYFTSDASMGYDHFYNSGDGQGQRLWHNMGSDENYNTYFTAEIYGPNGADTIVYPDTSNNLGGNDYNIDETVNLYN